MKSLWHEFCDQNSSALAAVLVAVTRSLAEVKEGRKGCCVHSEGTPSCPGADAGLSAEAFVCSQKAETCWYQLASFLATFRADLPPSLKLSLNWFFVCLFKDRITLCGQVGLEFTILVLPIECSGRS